MDIKNNSYGFSYPESKLLLTSVSILAQDKFDNNKDNSDEQRVLRLISNSISISKLLVSSRLEYKQDSSPSDDYVDQECGDMEYFISIPRDEITSRIVPKAIENYVWVGHKTNGIISNEKLSLASSMLITLLNDSLKENID